MGWALNCSLLCLEWRSSHGDAVVRSDGAEGGGGGAVVVYGGGGGVVRERGQEDEEREDIQGIVREREAEEEGEDRENQGQSRGSKVHSMASPLQAHLIITIIIIIIIARGHGKSPVNIGSDKERGEAVNRFGSYDL
ncbi:hypothetical protein Scep_002752 [Stephania cephalantha]|uniref:Uncharacterized protein n=1 Tax=Stephania cephalantha TaxID=152367 RepID=A0AAP0Q929_9MAGN